MKMTSAEIGWSMARIETRGDAPETLEAIAREWIAEHRAEVGSWIELKDKEVIVGNQNSTEQYIVGELMKQLLEDRGFKVRLVSGLSPVDLRERMEAGNIDLCADYTGTAWTEYLAQEYKPGMDNNEIYQLVKREDLGSGLVWLHPMWNSRTYVLASWTVFVLKNDLKTLSDLASLYREKGGEIKTSVVWEFSTRADGLPALKKYYNIEIAESWLQIEPSPRISGLSLKEHQVDVAMVLGTDAAIDEYDWHVYIDDKAFFLPYDLTPVIRREVLDKNPELVRILNELVATFTEGDKSAQEAWQELNAKVDMGKLKAGEVAHEYLVEHGLVKE